VCQGFTSRVSVPVSGEFFIFPQSARKPAPVSKPVMSVDPRPVTRSLEYSHTTVSESAFIVLFDHYHKGTQIFLVRGKLSVEAYV